MLLEFGHVVCNTAPTRSARWSWDRLGWRDALEDKQAVRAVRESAPAAPKKTSISRGLTLNNNAEIRRVRTTEKAKPIATPVRARRIPCHTTIFKISLWLAPAIFECPFLECVSQPHKPLRRKFRLQRERRKSGEDTHKCGQDAGTAQQSWPQ